MDEKKTNDQIQLKYAEFEKIRLTAKTEGRKMTLDEVAKCDKIIDEIQALKRELGTEDRFQQFEEWATKPQDRKIDFELGPNNRQQKPMGRKYEDLFGPTSNDGFRSFKEFLEVIDSGLNDPRLQKRTMTEGVPSSGGFLVPTEFAKQIFDISLESEIVRGKATVYPMSTLSMKIPANVIGDHSANLYGGMVANWKPETGALTEAAPTFRSMELTAHKLSCYAIASQELADDGIDLEQQISRIFANGLGWYLDRAFLTTGTGAGMPLAIKNSACLIVVDKEVGQTQDSILYENLTKMVSRIHPACFSNSSWVCHVSTIPSLLSLSVPVGTGGSFYPVLNESNGQFRMLTRPVIFTEKMNKLGDEFDILLADFSQYGIGLRKDLRFEKSIAPHFSQDLIDYRAILRVDGQPLWNAPLTLADGSTTVSPFITLQERA